MKDTFEVSVPHLYLGLGDYIHIYKFIYMYIWGETLFLGTGLQLMTRSWVVCCIINYIFKKIFFLFLDMYKNFLPLMETYHPMIYLL